MLRVEVVSLLATAFISFVVKAGHEKTVRLLYLASRSLALKTLVVMGQHLSLAPTMCSTVPQKDLQ